jgi:hypothetical protein
VLGLGREHVSRGMERTDERRPVSAGSEKPVGFREKLKKSVRMDFIGF